MCLKSCSLGSSFRGNWRFKANLCSSRLCMGIWFSNTSPEVEINIRLAATLVIFHISRPLDVPGHHIGGGGFVEVREVHHLLVFKEGVQHHHNQKHEDLVVEQGEIHHVSILSPRAKLDVAFLLLLRPKYRSSRDEMCSQILAFHTFVYHWTGGKRKVATENLRVLLISSSDLKSTTTRIDQHRHQNHCHYTRR